MGQIKTIADRVSQIQMAENEQTTELTQEDQDWLNLGGIYLRGTRPIARHMGVSPATISRWCRRFRGREEILLCFPAFELPTGKGGRWTLFTNTELIQTWMQRWVQIDGAKLRQKGKHRRKVPKVKRLGETTQRPGAPIEEERPRPTHEKPITAEELDNLGPVDKAWVINHEMTPAQREFPESPVREGCTCGTGIDCSVCNG
jgi:hypothetical protein